MTVAQDCKNPVCIKNNPANRWKGSTGEDAQGHARFMQACYCVRAWLITVWKKEANGTNTIRSLMRQYAPKDDTQGSLPGREPNDPDGYAEFVAKRAGIGPDDPFDIFEDATGRIHVMAISILLAIYRAIERMESGGTVFEPTSELLLGAALFYTDIVEKQAA